MDEDDQMSEREEYWLNIIQQWEASNIGLERWCLENEYSFYKVRYYKRKFTRKESARTFVEVDEESALDGKLVLRIGKTQIEVENGFNPRLLREVLQTLGGLQC